jgi:hypothetical protein
MSIDALSRDDWRFIDTVDSHFGDSRFRIAFSAVANVPLDKRLEWAEGELTLIPRSIFVAADIPADKAETLTQHTNRSMDISDSTIKKDPAALRRVRNMLHVSEIGKAITRDVQFTGEFSYEDLLRLEALAAAVIFEKDSHGMKPFYDEFIEGKTLNAMQARDIMRGVTLISTWEYFSKYPDLEPNLQVIWDRYYAELSPASTEAGNDLRELADILRENQQLPSTANPPAARPGFGPPWVA